MSIYHYIGASLVLILVLIAGAYSGSKVKDVKDFVSSSNESGAGMVMGSITGTLVGGASTIGTAQLAAVYGFSAWWFTLGAGLGCVLLATVFAKPLINSGSTTLSGLLSSEFGKKAGFLSALLMSAGSILTIISQILSGSALITSIVPINQTIATLFIVILMFLYVNFGGVIGTGFVGIIKLILLSLSVFTAGILAIRMGGGLGEYYATLDHKIYFNLIARGAGVDFGACLSLIVGVLTTQTYIQTITSAKSLKSAKRGVLLSAAIIPCLGIMCIFTGFYMIRFHKEVPSISALPQFLLQYFPPVLSGIALATLLLTLVGTGAGMSLGISSMLTNDIYKAYVKPNADEKHLLMFSRIGIFLVLFISFLLSTGNLGSMILNWSFMAMGFRGAVAFIPMVCALFFKGKIKKEFIYLAIIVGPTFVLLGKLILPPSIDPLFLGIIATFIPTTLGFVFNKSEGK